MIKRRTTLNIADNSGALTVQTQSRALEPRLTEKIVLLISILIEQRFNSLFSKHSERDKLSLTDSKFISLNKIKQIEQRSAVENYPNNLYCSHFYCNLISATACHD